MNGSLPTRIATIHRLTHTICGQLFIENKTLWTSGLEHQPWVDTSGQSCFQRFLRRFFSVWVPLAWLQFWKIGGFWDAALLHTVFYGIFPDVVLWLEHVNAAYLPEAKLTSATHFQRPFCLFTRFILWFVNSFALNLPVRFSLSKPSSASKRSLKPSGYGRLDLRAIRDSSLHKTHLNH